MSETDNIEFMKQTYAAFNAGDVARVLDAFANDADLNWPSAKGVPWTRPWHGREEIRRFFDELAEAEDFQEAAPNDFIAQGDKVVVISSNRSRVKSTGRVWEVLFAQVFTIRNGKIQKCDNFLDTGALAEAHST